jgi:hypothetical protein
VAAKTVPQLVVEAAFALYGEPWRSQLAESLTLHPRTVRRIGQAARTEEPHPVSPGVLAELAGLARASAAAAKARTPDGARAARYLRTLAHELDEAVRLWTPTRRPRKEPP